MCTLIPGNVGLLARRRSCDQREARKARVSLRMRQEGRRGGFKISEAGRLYRRNASAGRPLGAFFCRQSLANRRGGGRVEPQTAFYNLSPCALRLMRAGDSSASTIEKNGTHPVVVFPSRLREENSSMTKRQRGGAERALRRGRVAFGSDLAR